MDKLMEELLGPAVAELDHDSRLKLARTLRAVAELDAQTPADRALRRRLRDAAAWIEAA